MDTTSKPTTTTAKPGHYPLTRRSVGLAHLGLWLFGLLAAVSVFSLAREALGPSWPLGRALAHAAVLAVSIGLLYGTALLLHRHKAALARRTEGPTAPKRPASRDARPRTGRPSGRPVLR